MRKSPPIVVLAALLLALTACAPKPVRVEGTAMLPNFADGDKILTDENPGELRRGDVITFLYPKDTAKCYFKRIVGLPGETVEIRAGRVLIDGRPLDEPYLDDDYNRKKESFGPRTVPAGQYYVLGDNRDNSSDSRYW